MRIRRALLRGRTAAVAVAGVAVLLAAGGCGLEEVTIPGFDATSTKAHSLFLTASPDVVVADGVSTSVIVAMLRGPDGRGVGGRQILFTRLDQLGLEANIGTLSASSAITGSDGRARVVYTAPTSDHFQAHTAIHVSGRLVSENYAPQFAYHTVRIEVIPTTIRRFPEGENEKPVCGFNFEPRFGFFYVGVPIRFQSASFDPDGYIVRYEWRFGDGGREYVPDVYHTYMQEGTYFASHSVMDNFGAIESCDVPMIVVTTP